MKGGEAIGYLESDVRLFLKGDITWAQMAGVTKEQAFALADFGYNLFVQGKLVEAKKIFDGLVSLNPKVAYFFSILGSICGRQEKWDEALAAFDQAIFLGIRDPQVFVNRAEVLLALGQFEGALNDLKYAISVDKKGDHPASAKAKLMAEATLKSINTILLKSEQSPI